MRLLYFSPVHASSYAQRPHFMVQAWLQRGVESVLWVNPYPCRLPRWGDLRRASGLNDQGTPLDARVRVLDVPAMPIEPLPFGARFNRRLLWNDAWRELEAFVQGGPTILGVGLPCALALDALRLLKPASSFFDAMDNFSEFHRGLSRRAMRCHEDAIAGSVDQVVASSTFLADKFRVRGIRVEKVLNACEFDCDPTESRNASAVRRPVLGYLGCISHWFDWNLVVRLAASMPRADVELIGPCATSPPTNLPTNVRLFPACAHSEAAQSLSRFSAGLIPFKENRLTAGVDPIKYYEYRAAGLPVLSTRFGEMACRGREQGVYFLEDSEDLSATAAAALRHHYSPAETRQFRRNNDWTARFHQTSLFRSLTPDVPRMRAA